MLERLKKALHELWAPSRYTIPVNQGQPVQARLTDGGFKSRDAPASSPPAPTIRGTPRIGIVSPGPLEDLIPVDVPAVDQDDVVSVPGGAATSEASERSTARGHVIEEPRESSGTDAEVVRKRPLEEAQGVRASGVSGEVARSPSEDGEKQSPDRSSTQKRRSLESGEAGEDSVGEAAAEGLNADADRHATEGKGRKGQRSGETPQDRGEIESDTKRPRTMKTREEGVTKTGGDQRGDKTTSNAVDGLSAQATDTFSQRARGNDAPGVSLAFDMQSILKGCRKASRLKRKRDARNAIAHSFSGKLSVGGAERQDSEAAVRAFSRVLHKVSCDNHPVVRRRPHTKALPRQEFHFERYLGMRTCIQVCMRNSRVATRVTGGTGKLTREGSF